MKTAVLLAAAALSISSCSASGASDAPGSGVAASETSLEPVTTTSAAATGVPTGVPTVVVDITATAAATAATTSLPASAPTTLPAASTAHPVPTLPPSTVADTVATVPPATASRPQGTPYDMPYGMPIEPGVAVGYAREHHDYPASDIFAGDCGTTVVSPVNGNLLEVRRENLWSADTDNPATRGGKSVSLLGDDGVRYYFAHFDQIDEGIVPGATVATGDHLGQIGKTGRAGACHLHFALSPPCPGKEWSVRRGVVWPWPYLDAWQRGEQLSPADEVAQWVLDHPEACIEAMADAHAADS